MSEQRLLPQAIDAEQAILGALLQMPEAWTKVADILRPELFNHEPNRQIYRVASALRSNGTPVDTISVMTRLRAEGLAETVGAPAYLTQLTARVGSTANIEYHSRIIIEQFIARSLIRIGHDAEVSAYSTSDALALLDRVSGDISTLYGYLHGSTILDASTGIFELSAKKASDGLTFGIPDLDRMTMMQPGLPYVFAGRPGMGKCLGIDTPVLMFDGTIKLVQDIVVGDQVMGNDSTPRNVMSLIRGREMMYTVKQNKGMEYRVNRSHILSVKRSRNQGGYTRGSVLNLPVSDWMASSAKFRSNYKGYRVPVMYPNKELPIEPYFLGLWLGDGTAMSVNISTPDTEIFEYLQGYADRLGLTLHHRKNKDACPTLSITGDRGGGRSLQAKLSALGLLGNKHIPSIFAINSERNRLELLAGLLDTDGYYLEKTNVFEITQVNVKMAEEIQRLAQQLGFQCSRRTKRATIKRIGFECDVERLFISGDLDRIPTRVKRKQARPLNTTRNWLVSGITVTPDKEDDYYGFELDGNHLFLLGDCTVTHNSILAVHVFWHLTQFGNVLLFSPEMTLTQVQARIVSSESGVPYSTILRGAMNEHEVALVDAAIARIGDRLSRLKVDPTSGISPDQMDVRVERAIKKHGILAFGVDHLHKMKTGDKRVDREETAKVSQCMEGITGVAKKSMLPAVVFCQLNREVEKRAGKKPTLADLKQTGKIEEDAAFVGLLFRNGYYEEHPPYSDTLEISVAKNRDGAVGMAKEGITPSLSRIGITETFTSQTPF